MNLQPWEKSVQDQLGGEALSLARKYGCGAQVGCAVNDSGRVVWTVAIRKTLIAGEGATLAAAREAAASGCETAAEEAHRLRKQASAAIREAERLELLVRQNLQQIIQPKTSGKKPPCA